MSKRNKIIYWGVTIWLSLGMLSSGVVQLFRLKAETDFMAHLGYPSYFQTILGAWKLLGVAAILLPKMQLLEEWAYAGFFFSMSGAAFSHIASGTMKEIFPCLLLALTILSWYFRPADRKLRQLNP